MARDINLLRATLSLSFCSSSQPNLRSAAADQRGGSCQCDSSEILLLVRVILVKLPNGSEELNHTIYRPFFSVMSNVTRFKIVWSATKGVVNILIPIHNRLSYKRSIVMRY